MARSDVGQMSPNTGLGRILLFAACIPILVLLVLPSLIIVPVALTKGDLLQFPPIWISVHAFTDYLGDPAWVDSTVLSFKVSILAVAVGVVTGATAAIALHGRRFPGRNLVAGWTGLRLRPWTEPLSGCQRRDFAERTGHPPRHCLVASVLPGRAAPALHH